MIQRSRTEKVRPQGTKESAHARIATVVAGATLILWIAACTTEHGSPSTAVTDSSGVEIIMSSGFVWPEGSGWRLGDQPTLRIGVLEGDPAYEFYEIAGAWRLSADSNE